MSESAKMRLVDWEENPFKLKGELSMSHGRKWVTNSDRTEEIYLKPGEEVPEGWHLGRKKYPPRSEESRKRTSVALKGKTRSQEQRDRISKSLKEFFKKSREAR